MSRWKVERRERPWTHGYHWFVYPPGAWPITFSPGASDARVERYLAAGGEAFQTHAEALAHADRMARTVTVTLPRVNGVAKIPDTNGHPTDYHIFPKGVAGYYPAANLSGAWGHMGILHENDIEPIALALLALARKEQV